MDKTKTNDPRKPFVKPELTKVLLRPEEAVLGNCKVSGVNGPGQPDDTCGIVASCSTVGT